MKQRSPWWTVWTWGILAGGLVLAACGRGEPARADGPRKDKGPLARLPGGGASEEAGAFEVALPPGLFSAPAAAAYLFLKGAGVGGATYGEALRAFPPGKGRASLRDVMAYLREAGAVPRLAAVQREELPALHPGALVLMRPEREQEEGRVQLYLWRGTDASGNASLLDPLAGPVTLSRKGLSVRYRGLCIVPVRRTTREGTPAPDLVPGHFLYHFGVVEAGATLIHAFPIANRGNRPLHILRADLSCGCAGAMLAATPEPTPALRARLLGVPQNEERARAALRGVIPPGETRWVWVAVRTAGKTGPQAFAVRLHTNDPEEKELSLVLHGRVLPLYELDPQAVWFHDVPAAEGAVRWVWLRRPGGGGVRLRAVSVNRPDLEVALDPKAPRTPWHPTHPLEARKMPPRAHPAAEGWVALAVRLKPGARPGRFAATVRIELEGARLFVPVRGSVTGNLTCDPPTFAFGRVRQGQAARATLTLRSRMGKAFRVEGVETGAEFLAVRWQLLEPGVYRLTAVLRPGWRARALSGSVRLRTNDPLEPEKRIDYFGFVIP